MKRFLGILGAVYLVALLIAAFAPGLVTHQNAIDQDAAAVLSSPSLAHPAGTDSLGRDQLARLLDGARISLIVSLAATAIALLIGLSWGLGAGLAPPAIDALLMRTVDILYAVPDLLLYILMGLFLGRNPFGIIVALSSLSWLGIARLSRQETLKYRTQDFVTAARALGLTPATIAIRHILPQMREALLVSLIFKIPALIATESALSFVGLGLAPPRASFGTLAKEGFDAYLFYPHLITYPFLITFLTVFSFYAVGNYLKAD
jgi:oligopeptide transport system permease protein